MITTVSQVSSAWFDNKLVRKSLHNETNFNKCEFTEKILWIHQLKLLILCKIAKKSRLIVEFLPRGWIFWTMEKKMKFVFSAKGIIIRYTSKPERGLYLFYNPLINFFICNMLGEKEKQKNKTWAGVRMTQTSI